MKDKIEIIIILKMFNLKIIKINPSLITITRNLPQNLNIMINQSQSKTLIKQMLVFILVNLQTTLNKMHYLANIKSRKRIMVTLLLLTYHKIL
jgi:hypothetical protein